MIINTKFDTKQFGTIKGRSTVHALVDLTHKWHKAWDASKSVRAIFTDIPKLLITSNA